MLLHERFGLAPREVELRDAERHLDDADARPPLGTPFRLFERLLIGVERIHVTALAVQQVPELHLDFRGLRCRRGIGVDDERRRRNEQCRGRGRNDANAALHISHGSLQTSQASGYEALTRTGPRAMRREVMYSEQRLSKSEI